MSDLYHALNRRSQEFFQSFTNGQVDRVCIFGAGEYGIRLYHEMRNRGIDIQVFSDNNPDKWGYMLDNLHCISPERLTRDKLRTLVVVSMRNPRAVTSQLETAGFPYITTKEEIERRLSEIPLVPWIASLQDIEGIDYTSRDVQFLIRRFNQTLHDMYRYYEDRIRG